MEPKSKIDQWSTIISTLLAIAGIIIGVWEFNYQQRVTQTQVFKQKIWEQKQETYSGMARITGQIIVYRNDSVALDTIRVKYQNLYYSFMPMCEDVSVEKELIDFNTQFEMYQRYKNQTNELLLKKHQILLSKSLGISIKHIADVLMDPD